MNWEAFLRDQHVEFERIPHQPAYDAQHVAEALHLPGKHVAKTVLLRADRGFAYIVAVLPAPKMIDLQALSAALGGSRLELATEHEVSEHCPDCEYGVLPPFGSQYGMKTIVDKDLTSDEWIVFEGNTHADAIRMTWADFQRVEQPLVASFAVAPQAASSKRDR